MPSPFRRPPQRKLKFLTRDGELDLLLRDGPEYLATQKYLAPLIRRALGHFAFPAPTRKELLEQLLSDVPVAAGRYMRHQERQSTDYRFSVYFTWYIKERINAELKINKRPRRH